MKHFGFSMRSRNKRRSAKKIAWNCDFKRTHPLKYSKHNGAGICEKHDCRTVVTDGFQDAASSTLVFAQIFGIMPVVGITQNSSSKLHFKWICFRTIYSMIILLLAVIYTAFIYWEELFTRRIKFRTFVPLAFYSTTTYGIYGFIVLAKHWPQLIQHWEFVEAILPRDSYYNDGKQLSKRIRKILCILMSCALVEHCLGMASVLYIVIVKFPEKDPIEELFKIQMPVLFTITKLSLWNAILSKWFNLIMTFVWSYMDLFVITVSIGLSSLLKQLNTDLERVRGKHKNEKFWILRRIQYRQICTLIATVDKKISSIIFVSFANDLFFICVQLLNSLNEMASFIHGVYFWFSFSFLIARTLAVSLYSAEINDESKKPIQILRDVPRKSYCSEVLRFSEEVVYDEIALSGMKFFFLTRKLMLTIAGTILTYELVLMQFHGGADIIQ